VLYDGLSNTLKQREKCIKAAAVLLEQGTSVVVGKSYHVISEPRSPAACMDKEKSKLTRGTRLDNTNADPGTRAVWVNLAKETNVPIRCIHFTAGAKVCEHNDTVRALNLCPEVSRSARALPLHVPAPGHASTGDSAHASSAAAFGVDAWLVEEGPSMHALRRGKGRGKPVLTNALQTNPENRTMLPKMAFTGFASRYRQPTLLEGFTDITTVHFKVSTHQPRGAGAIKKRADQFESSMALKSRGRYGASIGFSR
jgi:hypothetical protein